MDIKKCIICGKSYKNGVIALPGGSGKLALDFPECSCEEDALKKKELQKRMVRLMEESNIPAKYRHDDMSDWIKVEGTEMVSAMSKIYLKNFKLNYDTGVGIFLVGHVGTGKTRLQCFMLKKVIEKIQDVSVYFLSSDQFNRSLGELNKSKRGLSEYREFLVSRGVLLLDDFGENKIPEWRMEHLTGLINERYYKRKVTWFNTMKPLAELEDLVGSHIVSRILEMCRGYVCEIESKIDMRREGNIKKYGGKV